MVQWGGSDHSMGIGRAGERYSPSATRSGAPRVRNGHQDGRAEFFYKKKKKKNRHFSVGTDITILHQWWKSQGEDMRKALGG